MFLPERLPPRSSQDGTAARHRSPAPQPGTAARHRSPAPQPGTQAYDERHFSYDGLLSYICFSTYTSKKEWTS